ncbi:MAG: putative metalloprotease CJM1_0395 family protein [Saccharospirillum sp.]
MATVSGLFPNTITPSVMAPVVDPAQQAVQRREAEAAVFPPVGEAEAVGRNLNRASERPARQGSQKDASGAATTAPTDTSDPPSERTRADANNQEASSEAGESGNGQSDRGSQAQVKQQQDIELIRELAQRDREVRAHEQAHMAVGGRYAGPMSLVFETGPDGRRYAVAGEVAIDTSAVPNNPQATIDKAEQIRRAALAPAEPSAQDRKVATQAIQMKLQAQLDVQNQQRAEREAQDEDRAENRGEAQRSSESRNEQATETDQAAQASRERVSDAIDQTRQASERILVLDQYRQAGPSGPGLGENLDYRV